MFFRHELSCHVCHRSVFFYFYWSNNGIKIRMSIKPMFEKPCAETPVSFKKNDGIVEKMLRFCCVGSDVNMSKSLDSVIVTRVPLHFRSGVTFWRNVNVSIWNILVFRPVVFFHHPKSISQPVQYNSSIPARKNKTSILRNSYVGWPCLLLQCSVSNIYTSVVIRNQGGKGVGGRNHESRILFRPFLESRI